MCILFFFFLSYFALEPGKFLLSKKKLGSYMLVSLNSGLGMGRSDTDSEEVEENVIFLLVIV